MWNLAAKLLQFEIHIHLCLISWIVSSHHSITINQTMIDWSENKCQAPYKCSTFTQLDSIHFCKPERNKTQAAASPTQRVMDPRITQPLCMAWGGGEEVRHLLALHLAQDTPRLPKFNSLCIKEVVRVCVCVCQKILCVSRRAKMQYEVRRVGNRQHRNRPA